MSYSILCLYFRLFQSFNRGDLSVIVYQQGTLISPDDSDQDIPQPMDAVVYPCNLAGENHDDGSIPVNEVGIKRDGLEPPSLIMPEEVDDDDMQFLGEVS